MSVVSPARLAERFSLLERSRALLVMALVVGSLGTFAGQGTLAFVTSLVQSDNNIFNAGVLDIKGDLLLPAALRGSASSLPTSTFRWIRTGTTADCGNTRPATDDERGRKFSSCATRALSAESTEHALVRLRGIELERSVRSLMTLLAANPVRVEAL